MRSIEDKVTDGGISDEGRYTAEEFNEGIKRDLLSTVILTQQTPDQNNFLQLCESITRGAISAHAYIQDETFTPNNYVLQYGGYTQANIDPNTNPTVTEDFDGPSDIKAGSLIHFQPLDTSSGSPLPVFEIQGTGGAILSGVAVKIPNFADNEGDLFRDASSYGDILVGEYVIAVYDGTDFIIISKQWNDILSPALRSRFKDSSGTTGSKIVLTSDVPNGFPSGLPYLSSEVVEWNSPLPNDGAMTIEVDGRGEVSLVDGDANQLNVNDIAVGEAYAAWYQGSPNDRFVLFRKANYRSKMISMVSLQSSSATNYDLVPVNSNEPVRAWDTITFRAPVTNNAGLTISFPNLPGEGFAVANRTSVGSGWTGIPAEYFRENVEYQIRFDGDNLIPINFVRTEIEAIRDDLYRQIDFVNNTYFLEAFSGEGHNPSALKEGMRITFLPLSSLEDLQTDVAKIQIGNFPAFEVIHRNGIRLQPNDISDQDFCTITYREQFVQNFLLESKNSSYIKSDYDQSTYWQNSGGGTIGTPSPNNYILVPTAGPGNQITVNDNGGRQIILGTRVSFKPFVNNGSGGVTLQFAYDANTGQGTYPNIIPQRNIRTTYFEDPPANYLQGGTLIEVVWDGSYWIIQNRSTLPTENVYGATRIATTSDITAGSDDTKIVTPLKLKSNFLSNPTTNGYLRLPSWLGGYLKNWGFVDTAISGQLGTVTFSQPFSSQVFNIQMTMVDTSFINIPSSTPTVLEGTVTTSQFQYAVQFSGFYWFAEGI